MQQAAAQAVLLVAEAYAYAKQGVGPLRPVYGPVYDRYHVVPLDLLKNLNLIS